MADIGRRIYYEKATGNVILDTGERSGDVIETTIEQDMSFYKVLAERVADTVGYIQLEYGQYADEFVSAYGYHVDVESEKILFTYSDSQDTTVTPVYQKPLSEEIAEAMQRLSDIEIALAELIVGGAA